MITLVYGAYGTEKISFCEALKMVMLMRIVSVTKNKQSHEQRRSDHPIPTIEARPGLFLPHARLGS